MSVKMSDTLDSSYGKNPMEQLTNIIFECKEGIDDNKYAIINELLLKVNGACSFNDDKVCHVLTFQLCSYLINATDQIKEDLDYMPENYNSDYEHEHDYEDDDDAYTITTDMYCKLYLDHKTYKALVLDFYSDFHSIIEESFKNKKSYTNYQTAINVGYEKHLKEVSKRIKDNIDYEWVKVKDTHIKYIRVSPFILDQNPLAMT